MATLPREPRTILKHDLGERKNVAWSRPFPLDDMKRVAHETSATVNDVLVSAVTGALRKELMGAGEPVGNVRAMVPIDARRAIAILPLPVGIGDPSLRLHEVRRRMNALERAPEGFVGVGLLRILGRLPLDLGDRGAAFFAKQSSLVLTNVPGPRAALHSEAFGSRESCSGCPKPRAWASASTSSATPGKSRSASSPTHTSCRTRRRWSLR
jgi:hypothetical protein